MRYVLGGVCVWRKFSDRSNTRAVKFINMEAQAYCILQDLIEKVGDSRKFVYWFVGELNVCQLQNRCIGSSQQIYTGQ